VYLILATVGVVSVEVPVFLANLIGGIVTGFNVVLLKEDFQP
jgi:hypothetical protein